MGRVGSGTWRPHGVMVSLLNCTGSGDAEVEDPNYLGLPCFFVKIAALLLELGLPQTLS